MKAEATGTAHRWALTGIGAALAGLWPVSGAAQSIAPVDGLRGVAVLLTMGLHTLLAWQLAPSGSADGTPLLYQHPLWTLGATGVHLFFVLSGFLLFLPYARAAVRGGAFPDTRKFYIRRALRILPAYWVSLLLLVVLFEPQYRAVDQWRNLIAHLFLAHDVSGRTLLAINPPYWTLAVESHFYLLLPLLAWGFWRLARAGRRRLAGALLLLLFAAGPGYGGLLWLAVQLAPTLHPYPSLEIVGYLPGFAAGMGAGLGYVAATEPGMLRWSAAEIQMRSRWVGTVGLLALGLYALLSGAVLVWDPASPLYWLVGNPLLALGYAGVLLGVLLGWPRAGRVLAAPGLRLVGLIAYSLYIWNWPLYQAISGPVARWFGAGAAGLLAEIVLGAAIILPFGFVFYSLVERPFIGARRARR